MNSKQESSPVFGPLTNHKAVVVKCILGSHRNCQGAVLKTNHGGNQGDINNFTKKNITGSHTFFFFLAIIPGYCCKHCIILLLLHSSCESFKRFCLLLLDSYHGLMILLLTAGNLLMSLS